MVGPQWDVSATTHASRTCLLWCLDPGKEQELRTLPYSVRVEPISTKAPALACADHHITYPPRNTKAPLDKGMLLDKNIANSSRQAATMVALQLLSVLLLALEPVSAIWPAPLSFSKGSKALFLNEDIRITYNGEGVGLLPSPRGRARRD